MDTLPLHHFDRPHGHRDAFHAGTRRPGRELHMRLRPGRADSRGFSLVEVLVAVVVICTGLLGIAKLQALSLSNTSTARLRSLAALEAASLASAMHSNRQYWAGTPPTSIVATPNPAPAPPTIGSSDAAMAAIATADIGGAFPGLPLPCVG